MKDINYKRLTADEIDLTLFNHFNRYQEVRRCFRKIDGAWVLKDVPFIEQWGEKDYADLVTQLRKTLSAGGAVVGAFEADRLIGFASVVNEFFGSNKDYLQLSNIHISYDFRGRGIGRKLFGLACETAKGLGAKKLYISAHSSEETQAFYHSAGCVEAVEYNQKLTEAEPCDCQMEFVL